MRNFSGTEIKYNLKTEEGVVKYGRTKYQEGFYNSDTIKRVSDDTLYVAEGTFTTCDKEDHPHFYFAGKQMKFIVNDKIIIRPITAYVNDIPVFWFPFYVYPIAKGRQSGFLTPRYGSSRRDGRYVSNMGYYFAPSDYWDYRVSGVLREKNGWLGKNWINYNKRYSLSGSVFGSYEDRSESGTKEWELQLNHRHTVSPTLTITGSGNFQSSEYSQYNSYNLYEKMNRDLRSSLSIQKKWTESGNSLTTTLTHEKNLDTENSSITLPSISFRKSRKQLFGSSDTRKSKRKYTKQEISGDEDEAAWYESIYYSFNSGFTNTQEKFANSDSTNSFTEEFNRKLTLSSGLSGSYKLMGWLVSEPSLNLNETLTASNEYDEEERYRRNDNISASLGLSTTVYGMFAPNIGNVKGIRHVVKPSVSYSYGKKRYYYSDGADAFFKLDENDQEDGKIQSMDLNLRNIFQVKTVNGEKENKFDLFTLNFSSSIDFEEEDKKIGPLSTTFDFTPLQKYMTTRLTATHDFYHDDDKFYLFSPYLTNLSITTSLKHSGSGAGFMGRSSRDDANSNLGSDDFTLDEFSDTEVPEEKKGGTGGFPIDMQFSHSYQLRRSTQISLGKYKYTTTHTLKPTINFSPTKNMSVNYYIYYDIKKKEVNYQRIVISRDLHCWEANLSWVPSGSSEGYYFKVNIKDLPDIKIEKRRGTTQTSY